MNIKHLLLFLLIVTAPLIANIFEHHSLKDIHAYIDQSDHHEKTLFIFDLDNTLVRYKTALGNDEWFSFTLSKLTEKGYSHLQALELLLPLYFKMAHHLELEILDEYIIELLAYLHEHNIPTIALTSRSLPIAQRTLDELQRLGINFISPECPFDIEINGQLARPYFCKNAIIFCNDNDKGLVLKDLLNKVNYFPTKVIFIDDKHKYLISLQKALKEIDLTWAIEYIGIRHTGADHFVKTFDPIHAHTLLCEFLARII